MTATELERPGAPVEIPTEFVKICHYGTGKFADSPVTLTLPKRVTKHQTRMIVTLEFALAFRDAYERATTAAEVQKLASQVGNLSRRWRHGDYEWCKLFQKDIVRWLQREDMAAMRDFPQRKTVEEDMVDSLGLLAAASEFPNAPKPLSVIDGTWLDDFRVFDLKRAAIDGSVALAAGAGALATATTATEPAHALWFGLVALFLRFSKPLSKKHPDVGLLEYEAYYQYPGDYKTRRALAQAVAKGARGEAVIQLVAQARREKLMAEESAHLADRITHELSPMLPTVEARSMLAVAQEEAELTHSSGWELLQAQRAVLTEIREAQR